MNHPYTPSPIFSDILVNQKAIKVNKKMLHPLDKRILANCSTKIEYHGVAFQQGNHEMAL